MQKIEEIANSPLWNYHFYRSSEWLHLFICELLLPISIFIINQRHFTEKGQRIHSGLMVAFIFFYTIVILLKVYLDFYTLDQPSIHATVDSKKVLLLVLIFCQVGIGRKIRNQRTYNISDN